MKVISVSVPEDGHAVMSSAVVEGEVVCLLYLPSNLPRSAQLVLLPPRVGFANWGSWRWHLEMLQHCSRRWRLFSVPYLPPILRQEMHRVIWLNSKATLISAKWQFGLGIEESLLRLARLCIWICKPVFFRFVKPLHIG
jgi:hypothetical protein